MTGWDILGKDIEWGGLVSNESSENRAVSLSELATFQTEKDTPGIFSVIVGSAQVQMKNDINKF